jgi:hypothetical protein
MPQASDAQRELMAKWFGGDGIDDGPPYAFLMSRGWTDKAGMLVKPTRSYSISQYEWECICFLCDEWDYGFDPDITA